MKRGVSLAFWQNELESKIRQAEQHKNSFIHYLQSLKEKCLKREITYEKYLKIHHYCYRYFISFTLYYFFNLLFSFSNRTFHSERRPPLHRRSECIFCGFEILYLDT